MAYYYGWKPYVSVAARRHRAQKEMQRLRKQGVDIQPVAVDGRKIAKTFWGEAWCKHMESQGDFANRLPRGRTYVRNGSVCHLVIERGKINAMVSGSDIYNVTIEVELVAKAKWNELKCQCSGQIGSLVELLKGRISGGVMQVMTDPQSGLFPLPTEIDLDCDCPDYATMCKHAAAVLYGVGARLDRQPELLFQLRGANHLDLITASADATVARATRSGKRRQVAAGDLADVFGIELDGEGQHSEEPTKTSPTRGSKRKPPRKSPLKKTANTTASKRSAARVSSPAKTLQVKASKTPKTTKSAASAELKVSKQPPKKPSTKAVKKKATAPVAKPKKKATKKKKRTVAKKK